jgi:septal ring factor EnvC (AmiA/AmiB activator)
MDKLKKLQSKERELEKVEAELEEILNQHQTVMRRIAALEFRQDLLKREIDLMHAWFWI